MGLRIDRMKRDLTSQLSLDSMGAPLGAPYGVVGMVLKPIVTRNVTYSSPRDVSDRVSLAKGTEQWQETQLLSDWDVFKNLLDPGGRLTIGAIGDGTPVAIGDCDPELCPYYPPQPPIVTISNDPLVPEMRGCGHAYEEEFQLLELYRQRGRFTRNDQVEMQRLLERAKEKTQHSWNTRVCMQVYPATITLVSYFPDMACPPPACCKKTTETYHYMFVKDHGPFPGYDPAAPVWILRDVSPNPTVTMECV